MSDQASKLRNRIESLTGELVRLDPLISGEVELLNYDSAFAKH
jgi:hypothetical protein